MKNEIMKRIVKADDHVIYDGGHYQDYEITKKREGGFEETLRTDSKFLVQARTPMVSWKSSTECPNGASEIIEFSHKRPHLQHVDLRAEESYITTEGRHIGREVYLTLHMEMRRCVRTIPKMLMASIKAHAMLSPECLALRKSILDDL